MLKKGLEKLFEGVEWPEWILSIFGESEPGTNMCIWFAIFCLTIWAIRKLRKREIAGTTAGQTPWAVLVALFVGIGIGQIDFIDEHCDRLYEYLISASDDAEQTSYSAIEYDE